MALTDALFLRQFSIFDLSENTKTQVKLIKEASHHDLLTKVEESQAKINYESLIIWNETFSNDNFNMASRKMEKGLMIFKDHSSLKAAIKNLKFNIGQEVYLYEATSKEVHEMYEVNDYKIVQTLGHFNESSGNMEWKNNIEQNH